LSDGLRSAARKGAGAAMLAVACALAPAATAAQRTAQPVRYEVSFDNASHHEAIVTVEFPGVRGPLEVRMSRTSPGRYALHEFAKNVYDVHFEDGGGRPLDADRPDLHQWTVRDHDGTVRMTYILFGDRRDGTYAAIGPDGAMLNAPATFAWARGLESRPAEVRFSLRPGWSVATQMPLQGDSVYHAPDLAYLMDSPVLIGDLATRTWTATAGHTQAEITFAVAHQGSAQALDDYVDWVRAIVDEEAAVFGEFPEFDYGTYTFLASYLPWADGDGMEHRNSTVLTRAAALPDDASRVIGTVAHEFFHAWNVERIRPATLEPFDFEDANVSQELWFAEGFTSYYDDLTMARAGIIDPQQFGAALGGMVNAVTNSPGRRLFSPVEMSMQAPFVDAAVSVDPQNRGNTFISYYTWGAALGLALDLAIRDRFPGKTLDDVMRRMWEMHGKPFQPYRVADVEAALAQVTTADFASMFFSAHVRGSELPDYGALLATVGYALESARPDQVVLAFERLDFSDAGTRVVGYPSVWSPLYAARVSEGDVISHVDGAPVRSAQELLRVLEGKRVGQSVTATVNGRLGWHDVQIELAADPALRVRLDESAAGTVVSAREQWLAAKADRD